MKFIDFLLNEFNEILLEYKDWFGQRSSHYGAWVNTKSKEVHYVELFGHETFIEDYLKKHKISTTKPISDYYNWAIDQGWVRLVFDNSQLGVEGTLKSIKEAGPMIMSTLNSPPKIQKVEIELEDRGKFLNYSFQIPKERYKLGQFLEID